MGKDLREALESLNSVVKEISQGKEERVDDLMQMTADTELPESVLVLAEYIGGIVVQKEIREYRLELIIEDLLTAQAELEKAKLDALTGLPNRSIFHETLHETCSNGKKKNIRFALLFIDLDKFKQVNDTMGHDAGDELLIQVSERLKECLGEKNFVARLGGDEFTAIMNNIPDNHTAIQDAQAIVNELNRPFDLQAGKAEIGGSIGMSFFPEDADTSVSLLKNADIAMYKAKEHGRNNVQLYKDMTP